MAYRVKAWEEPMSL
ncbi:hypothetical protein CLS_05290 [[Clostridium] cf. saccharolyticum K10]|nr:hypothetical protein CLS_05290 [[Clostridium] cf. saccharolyticum K10]